MNFHERQTLFPPPGIKVYVSKFLPQEITYQASDIATREVWGIRTGRYNHALILETQNTILVSQELYDRITHSTQ